MQAKFWERMGAGASSKSSTAPLASKRYLEEINDNRQGGEHNEIHNLVPSSKKLEPLRSSSSGRHDDDVESQSSMRTPRNPGEFLTDVTTTYDPAQLENYLADNKDNPDELCNIARESVLQLRRLWQVNRLARELSKRYDRKSQYAYIIRTLSQLVEADRAILYVVDPEQKCLRMQVSRGQTKGNASSGKRSFDKGDNAADVISMPIPMNQGLAGHVATTGQCINIPDIKLDERFGMEYENSSTDAAAISVLTIPIGYIDPKAPVRLGRGFTSLDLETVHQQDLNRILPEKHREKGRMHVIGVIQVINKRDEGKAVVPFTSDDVVLLESSSSIVAGYMMHVELREREFNERRRKEAILDIAVALGATLDIRSLVWTVVRKLQMTFMVDRCSLFFVDPEAKTLWTVATSSSKEWLKVSNNDDIVRLPMDKGILGYVARTGELVNVKDAYEDERFNKDVDIKTEYRTHTILCGAIKNSEGAVIAVVQLINKKSPEEEHPPNTGIGITPRNAAADETYWSSTSSKTSILDSNKSMSMAHSGKGRELISNNQMRTENHISKNRTGAASLTGDFRVHNNDMLRRGSVVYGAAIKHVEFNKEDEQLLSGMFSMMSVAIANTELFSKSFIARHRLKCVLENVSELVITVDKEGFLMGCNRSSTELNQLFGTDIPTQVMRTTKVLEWLPEESMINDIQRVLQEAIKDERQARNLNVTRSEYPMAAGGHVVNYSVNPMFGMGNSLSKLINAQEELGNMQNDVVKRFSEPSPMAAGGKPPMLANQKLSKIWDNFGSNRSLFVADSASVEDTDLTDTQAGAPCSNYGSKNATDSEVIGAVLCIDDKTPEQKLRNTLNKYLAPDVVDHLLHDGQLKLGGSRQKVSILFSDIRGFTTFSEKVGAKEVFATLNEYFSCMVEVITRHGGIVDKFIGDALMAVFGVPKQSSQDAYNACMAAKAMEIALKEFNAPRRAQGKPVIKIGVGVSTGEVFCGNIGSENRFEYTVIGDAVNVASRLESSTKEFSVTNLVSAATFEDIKDSGCPVCIVDGSADLIESADGEKEVIYLREVDRVRVAGKDDQTQLFEIIGAGHTLNNAFTDRQVRALHAYNMGLKAYRSRDVKEALQHFNEAADLGDGPACLFEERCEFLIENPPEESWDGIWDMQKVSVWTYNPGILAPQASQQNLQIDPLTRRMSRKSVTDQDINNNSGKRISGTENSSMRESSSMRIPRVSIVEEEQKDEFQESDFEESKTHRKQHVIQAPKPRIKRSKSIILHPGDQNFYPPAAKDEDDGESYQL